MASSFAKFTTSVECRPGGRPPQAATRHGGEEHALAEDPLLGPLLGRLLPMFTDFSDFLRITRKVDLGVAALVVPLASPGPTWSILGEPLLSPLY